jgi:hypothetical protein
MASETLKLIITGDASGAVKELKKVDAQADKALTGTKKNTDGLSKALSSINTGTLVAGFAALGTAAVAFGADAVQAAADDQAAHATLRQSVENTGAAYDEYGSQIESVEKKLINLGFADDETAASLTRLTGATGDVGEAVDQMGLAADIARGRHISLAQATDILVKVEAGRVGSLGRLGIATKDANGQTISQEEAIKRLTKLYGGQASAYADTYAGKLEVLSAKAGELKEKIGYELIPVFEDLAEKAIVGVDVFTTVADQTEKLGIGFGDLVHGVAAITPGLSTLTAGFDLLGIAQGESNDEVDKATDVTKRLQEATVAYRDDLAAGTAGTKEGKEHRDALNAAQEDAAAITQGLADVEADSAEATKKSAEATEEYGKQLKAAAERQREYVDGVLATSAALGDQEASFIRVRQGVADLNEAEKDGSQSADELRLKQLALEDQVRGVADAAAEADRKTQELANGHQTAGEKADVQKAALQKLKTEFPQLATFIDGLISGLDRIPRNITTTVTVRASGDAAAAIRAGKPIDGFAAGGPVKSGVPIIVGEEGPELFVPGSSGSIVPNGKGIGSAAGGGMVVNLVVNAIDARGAKEAVLGALKDIEREYGRVPIKVA